MHKCVCVCVRVCAGAQVCVHVCVRVGACACMRAWIAAKSALRIQQRLLHLIRVGGTSVVQNGRVQNATGVSKQETI